MNCNCEKICCPVETTLKLMSGKYKTLILWHLLGGAKRHGELHRLIPQATPKMLTQQLRELENDNLIKRKVFAVVPPKVEYSLTKTGFSLKDILFAMYDWGTDYMESKGIKASCSMKKDEKCAVL